MKIVAVTACPTGIAHTYMAADVLQKEAQKRNIHIKVETQGAMGIENALTIKEIIAADIRMIVSDIDIEEKERFKGCHTFSLSIEDVLTNVHKVIDECLAHR